MGLFLKLELYVMPETCFKIVDLSPDGTYSLLMHGVNRSKLLPFNTWIKAERKWAGEGGLKYWTGFHVLKSEEACLKYMKKFRDKTKARVIIKVLAKGLTPKPRTKVGVFLAKELKVIK